MPELIEFELFLGKLSHRMMPYFSKIHDVLVVSQPTKLFFSPNDRLKDDSRRIKITYSEKSKVENPTTFSIGGKSIGCCPEN